MKQIHEDIAQVYIRIHGSKEYYLWEKHGLNDGFNHTIGLGVSYGFTQSRPELNPW
jgi:hypothetical protein